MNEVIIAIVAILLGITLSSSVIKIMESKGKRFMSYKAHELASKNLSKRHKRFIKEIKNDSEKGFFHTFVAINPVFSSDEYIDQTLSYISELGYSIKLSEDKSYFEIRW